MPVRAKPYGEHSEVFFSLSSLKFASDENRTQELLRVRRYRARASQLAAGPFANV